MNIQINDTNSETEKILIELNRGKTVSQRLIQFQDLTSLTLRLSKRAIARRYPEKSHRELDLLFVKYHYGEELFDKVKQYLSKMSNEKK